MTSRLLAGVALAGLAAGPWVLGRDLLTALLFTFLLVTLASNYDLLGGFLGLYNLGQASFFGLGAYVTFLLILRLPGLAAGWGGVALATVAGAAAAAVAAALLAYPLLRLRGAYFAVGTFALLLMLRLLVDNLPGVTGGSHGLYVPVQVYLSLPTAYLLTLGLAAGSLALNRAVAASRLGMAMLAVRENEAAAAASGVDRFRTQQVAFVLGAVPTALAGAVFGLHGGYIDVSVVLGVERSLFPVIAAMLGGSGLAWGPVVGSVVLRTIDVGLKNYLHLAVPALALYGVVLMVMALAMPRGILALLEAQRSGRRPARGP
ncbi:MAG: branched-chain amino acid ABC transporter permease [Firmicutes bacterium]|nr:branched-chain amino acid ABC transporter permease [Bacillota bacterium]